MCVVHYDVYPGEVSVCHGMYPREVSVCHGVYPREVSVCHFMMYVVCHIIAQ